MRALLIAAFLLAPAPLLLAQGQGTAAQKDKDKEKEKAKPAAPKKGAPAYTDDDLKKARDSDKGNVTFLPPLPAGSEPPSGGEGHEGSTLQSDENQWRARAKEHRDAVAAAEEDLKNLETRLGELTNDMTPNPGDLFDPARLQKREAQKQELIPKVEEAKVKLAAERKSLADLEQEAREKNIPPGWLQPKS